MDRLDETETCGSSRELIRKLLKMPPQEQDAMRDEERTQMTLAFYHVQNCVHRDIPNLCVEFLEKKLYPVVYKKNGFGQRNKKYDWRIARYFAFAECAAHNTQLTDDNPLKKLKDRR